MLEYEASFYWAAVTIYAAASIAYLSAFVFKEDRWLLPGALLTLLGLCLHGGSVVAHFAGPVSFSFIGAYGLISLVVWVSLAVFLIFQRVMPATKVAGAAALPLGVLLLGGGFYLGPVSLLGPVLRGFWLMLYVLFAELGFDSIFVGFVLAQFLLLRSVGPLGKSRFFSRMPTEERLDVLSYRFSAFGFFLLGITILSGSVWANQVWGRYWVWDPTGVWLLVTWSLFGMYLCCRTLQKWQASRRYAWILTGAGLLAMSGFVALLFV